MAKTNHVICFSQSQLLFAKTTEYRTTSRKILYPQLCARWTQNKHMINISTRRVLHQKYVAKNISDLNHWKMFELVYLSECIDGYTLMYIGYTLDPIVFQTIFLQVQSCLQIAPVSMDALLILFQIKVGSLFSNRVYLI